MGTPIHEAVETLEASAPTRSGRMVVQAISAGVGSSGYYSPAVLEQAATNRLIKRGTPLHLDHPTASEDYERPVRSVQTIAGVFTSDAHYDTEREALVGEVQVFTPYRERLAEMAPYIGLSIRGSATDVTEGVVEGRKVPVIEGLAAIESVDFVTRAGRGGQVLVAEEESPAKALSDHLIAEYGPALAEAGLELAPVVEAKYTADQLRQMLADGKAIRNENGDPSYPIGDVEDLRRAISAVGRGGSGHNRIRAHIIKRAKALGKQTMIPDNWGADGSLGESATGDTGVLASPAGQQGNHHQKEAQMGTIQVDEAEHRRLTEAAGRVQALEGERDTAVKERDEARAERDKLAEAKAASDRNTAAAKIIAAEADKAGVEFSTLEAKGLVADLPLKDGALDEAAFTTSVTEAAAEKAKAQGAGRPHGFGDSRATAVESDEATALLKELDKINESLYGAPVKEA